MGGLLEFYRPGPSPEATDDCVQYTQDVEPYIEANKELAKEKQTGDMVKVGSIPHVITMQWMQEDGIYWPRLGKKEKSAYLRRKLNDPDYQYLKTIPGQY